MWQILDFLLYVLFFQKLGCHFLDISDLEDAFINLAPCKYFILLQLRRSHTVYFVLRAVFLILQDDLKISLKKCYQNTGMSSYSNSSFFCCFPYRW